MSAAVRGTHSHMLLINGSKPRLFAFPKSGVHGDTSFKIILTNLIACTSMQHCMYANFFFCKSLGPILSENHNGVIPCKCQTEKRPISGDF